MSTETHLKNATEGGYDFKIKEILQEAWQKTKGIKGAFWSGFLFNLFIGILVAGVIAAGMLLPDLVNHLTATGGKWLTLSVKITGLSLFFLVVAVILLFTLPLFAGLVMLSVRRSIDLPVKFSMIFNYFPFKYQFLFAMFLAQLITNAPSSIINGIIGYFSSHLVNQQASSYFILGGLLAGLGLLFAFCLSLYFMISYLLYIPLIADKKLNAWRALEASRKAITFHWFKVFFLMISMLIILGISAIPLGVGLIWTMPMMNNTIGILYRTIFGVENQDNHVSA